MASIKAIAFDFGGVYFHWDHHHWFNHIGKEISVSGKFFKKAYLNELSKAHKGHLTAKQHMKRIAKYIEQKSGKKISPKKLYQIMFELPKPMKEMVTLAKKLRKKGYKIALFSNHTTMIHDLNRKWKFWKHFDHPIASVDVGMEKPEPKFYRHLIKTLNCKPREIVFIDDIEVNVKAGKKLGIHCILFNGNFEKLLMQLGKLGVKV